MTELAVPAALVDDRKARRNVLVLAAAGALGGSAAPISFADRRACRLSAARRRQVASRRVPVTAFVVGTACGTVPAALLMRRIGRRPGFIIGHDDLHPRRLRLGVRDGRVRVFLLLCVGTFLRRLRRRLRAAVPLRGGRHGERRVPPARNLAGADRRHRRRRARPADRHPHRRSLRRRALRRRLPRLGRSDAARRAGSHLPRHPASAAARPRRDRAAARRDRAAAAIFWSPSAVRPPPTPS